MNETPRESNDESPKLALVALLEDLGWLDTLAGIFPGLQKFLESPDVQLALAEADNPNEAIAHASEFFLGPEILAQTEEEIFIFGDSIAEGVASHFPKGQGLRGYTTARLLDSLTSLLNTPDLTNVKSLVLFCGGNDINGEIPLGTSIQNIREMVSLLKQSGIQPVLATKYITDQYSGVEGTQEIQRIQEFNQAVIALGQEEGVPVLDVGQKYPDPSGVHDASRYQGISTEIKTEILS